MSKTILTMTLLKGNYGVCRFEQSSLIPEWAMNSNFFSVTKTEEELSVVCDADSIPQDVICERQWRILKVEGPLDFSLVGILSAISKILADCGVSIFAISTYDTDYILLKEKDVETGIAELKKANYAVNFAG